MPRPPPCWPHDPQGALRRARAARAPLPGHPVTTVHVRSMLTEARAVQALGRAEAAELAWARLLVTCEQAGFAHLRAVSEQSYAAFLRTLGREAEAVGRLRSAVGLFRPHGHRTGSSPVGRPPRSSGHDGAARPGRAGAA